MSGASANYFNFIHLSTGMGYKQRGVRQWNVMSCLVIGTIECQSAGQTSQRVSTCQLLTIGKWLVAVLKRAASFKYLKKNQTVLNIFF